MIENVESENWLARWDEFEWRETVDLQLRSLIWNRDTSAADRLAALKLLHDAVHSQLLPADPTLPEVALAVLMAMARGSFKVSLLRRIGLSRRQRLLSERLVAIQSVLLTASTFAAQEKLREHLVAQRPLSELVS